MTHDVSMEYIPRDFSAYTPLYIWFPADPSIAEWLSIGNAGREGGGGLVMHGMVVHVSPWREIAW